MAHEWEEEHGDGTATAVPERGEEEELDDPGRWSVFILNDDYTPTDVVTAVLVAVFAMGEGRAQETMREAHERGRALCETTSHDVAETRCAQVGKIGQEMEVPLRAEMERA